MPYHISYIHKKYQTEDTKESKWEIPSLSVLGEPEFANVFIFLLQNTPTSNKLQNKIRYT
jgi:hypothetical protein